MFASTQGVLAAPPTTGLVVSAVKPPDDGVRWEQGIAWVPERCGSAYQLVSWCSADDPDVYAPPRTGGAYYRPVGARFAVECAVMGGRLDTERLRRIAEAATPFVIARELWDGAEGQDDSWSLGGVTYTNAYLASGDAAIVGSGGAAPLAALAALEYAAASAARGQQVMLHVPIMATGGLGEHVRRVGGLLLTRQDNIVVVDAGYPGTGPAGQPVGATAWAYATTPVIVRWSPLQVLDAPPQTVDRAANTVTAWAERAVAAYFDPCAHFAVEITL